MTTRWLAVMMSGLFCLAAPVPVCAQRVDAAQAAQTAAPAVVVSERSANETRQELHELLNDHPPSVREVLQRDPGLLTNESYLAAYPRLAAYVRAHPEIGRAPVFYLGAPERDRAPESPSLWMWRELTGMISVGAVFLGLGLGLAWLVRTVLDHRRWQRVSRVQVDTHTKILDRITTSEDLRAYIDSPAGRQFLESAPIALDGTSAPIAAPVNRILWSVQAGVVALFSGIALSLVGKIGPIVPGEGQPLQVLGILLAAIGAGFLVSAGISYVLSRHLGLLQSKHTQG